MTGTTRLRLPPSLFLPLPPSFGQKNASANAKPAMTLLGSQRGGRRGAVLGSLGPSAAGACGVRLPLPWTPPARVARPVARCWPSYSPCQRPCFSTADVASLYLRCPTFSRRTVPRCPPPRSRPCHGGWIEPTGTVQRHADGQVVAVGAAPADEQPRSDEPPRSSWALVQEQGWTTSRSCRPRSAGTCRPQR